MSRSSGRVTKRSNSSLRQSLRGRDRIALPARVPHTGRHLYKSDARYPVTAPDRQSARSVVLDGLDRLRAAFPLEARLHSANDALRRDYCTVLNHWIRGRAPAATLLAPERLAALQKLDAVVPDAQALGCYPFSARATGITVHWPVGPATGTAATMCAAMCAIDALAVARLVRAAVRIDSSCEHCGQALAVRVEANGGLDHDQAERAQVVWLTHRSGQTSCSQWLCRRIRFVCNDCHPAEGGTRLTLPQAAAIGNAFFAFQQQFLDTP